MLIKQIIKYHPPEIIKLQRWKKGSKTKPTFKAGSDDHKLHIFAGTLEQAKTSKACEDNTDVYIRGRKFKAGIVLCIEEDISRIRWDGLKACCVEVYFKDDNSFELFHPSDIKELT